MSAVRNVHAERNSRITLLDFNSCALDVEGAIIPAVEMEDMYHHLASKLGKTDLEKSKLLTELPELKVNLGGQCKRKRERLGLTVK